MLELLNETRTDHLITIEDPIEFVFQEQKCIISQREIGHDTWSFANALRSAMREDPNIIFVGEIRDRETAESVLSLAETGHLVFSTLHT
jgi:twitching motility protein PilT